MNIPQIALEDGTYIYNFSTGKIFYKPDNGNVRETGISKDTGGYHQVRMNGKMKMVHRVLFEKYHNIIIHDNLFVDHINRIRTDNCINNLRLVTRTMNNQNINMRKDNTSGYKNISWDKSTEKWKVQFRINRKDKHFGRFLTLEEAKIQRDKTKNELNEQGHIFT